MKTLEERQAAVDSGIKVLDATWPGWREFLDTDILDMSTSEHCVLAQVATNMGLERDSIGESPFFMGFRHLTRAATGRELRPCDHPSGGLHFATANGFIDDRIQSSDEPTHTEVWLERLAASS